MTNRDLNYSRLFDVHRWSDHPEVNALEDRLYEVHLNPPVYGADIKSPPSLGLTCLSALPPQTLQLNLCRM